jgi:hypothetical protein
MESLVQDAFAAKCSGDPSRHVFILLIHSIRIYNLSLDLPEEWALAPQLSEKKFLASIQGTKGVGGWEGGRQEGMMVAFDGPGDAPGTVKVLTQSRNPKHIEIPARFLMPVKPYRNVIGSKAFIIFGEEVGAEVEVRSTEGDEWFVSVSSGARFLFCRPTYIAGEPIFRR